MPGEILGIPLASLEDPIRAALAEYTEMGNGQLNFIDGEASWLTLTPDEPNSARSKFNVILKYEGQEEAIGELVVIAFKPGDATGKDTNLDLRNWRVSKPYPRDNRILPRVKKARKEVHLNLASAKIDLGQNPELFIGTYDLIGLTGVGRIGRIGRLGRPTNRQSHNPIATYTVGYNADGQRFGDPHAVFSSIEGVIQVGGFFAPLPEFDKKYPFLLNLLYPQDPF